jgi:hypothetical protein
LVDGSGVGGIQRQKQSFTEFVGVVLVKSVGIKVDEDSGIIETKAKTEYVAVAATSESLPGNAESVRAGDGPSPCHLGYRSPVRNIVKRIVRRGQRTQTIFRPTLHAAGGGEALLRCRTPAEGTDDRSLTLRDLARHGGSSLAEHPRPASD